MVAATAAGVAARADDHTAGAAMVEDMAPYELLDAAFDAWNAREWERLEPMATVLCRDNPYKGPLWNALGDARYALKKYAGAADAYAKAAQLGFHPGAALYNMGCCLALMGETERAIDAVEEAIGHGLQSRERLIREDSDLDSIRDTDAFHERILPAVPEGVSRAEGWRIDLKYMHERMEATHWDLYGNISREDWRRGVDAIRDNVESMSDDDIIFSLMQLFAKIGDGHTGVVPPMGEDGWRALPVNFYLFKDGLFVESADGRYADAVGQRVVRIGSVDAEEAYDRCATVTPRDNPQQIKWLGPLYMTVMQVLTGLDIADQTGHVDVVVADGDGNESTVRFESVPFTRDVFGRRFENKVTMRDHAPEPKPLWAKYRDQHHIHYAFEYLPDDDLVYFWFDSVRDADEGESLEAFSKRLFDFIEEEQAGALVIDVHLNNGGNNFLIKPIIDGIIRSDRIGEKGTLYVIIGRETFSACQNFVNRLEREATPWFVGEPTASRPNFVGEDNKIELPYSGLVVRGSSRYWQDSISDDERIWIAPHLVAEMTSNDYSSNRYQAMDVIRASHAHARGVATETGAR
jgi:hypothetical protein